jgi:anti-anti-sigma factor
VSVDPPLSTHVEHHDSVSCVAVSGEIDIVKVHALRKQLTGAVRNEDLGLVIDLSEASYLDSVGVSLLFELAERLAERQLRMAVVLPEGGLVTRVLRIVNLGSVAEIHPTADEAIGAISRG